MSAIYKRGKTWYLQWVDADGKRRQKSLGTTDDRLARHLQRQHDAATTLHLLAPAPSRVRLVEAAAEWLAARAGVVAPDSMGVYVRTVRVAVAGAADHGAEVAADLSTAVLDRAVVAWREAGTGPATIRARLSILRRIVLWLVERGDLPADPVSRWPRPKARVVRAERIGAYTGSEVARILAWFRAHCPRLADHVAVLAYTGARVGEVTAIRRGHVDLERREVRIRNAKTEAGSSTAWRHIRLHRDLLPTMDRLCRGLDHDDLLLHRPVRSCWLQLPMIAACRDLGIQYRRVHGLRHSWITRMLEAGAPLAVVMQQAGHRSLATTQRYLHVSREASDWVDRL